MVITKREYLRSTLFGIEDSLVSTTGLLAGISIGAENNHVVILAGLVAIIIEAVSMGIGEYVSDDALEELDKIKRHSENPLLSGFFMFSSYLLAGMIPFSPIVIFQFPQSLIISVLVALLSLFLLGYCKGKIVKTSPLRGGMKILLVGGITTLLGIAVGLLLKA